MRRTLLTLLKDVNYISLFSKRHYMSFLVSFFVATAALAQAPQVGFLRSCTCLNNSDDPSLSQFSESFIINANNSDTWTVVSATDFYRPSSPAPPAAPIPYQNGDVIPLVNPTSNSFILMGIRTPDTQWNITISNGVSEFTYSAIHVCQNPTPEIFGDIGNCIESTKTYYIDVENNNINSGTWSLTGGGTILSGQGTNTIEVFWGDVEGIYNVSFNGVIGAFPGQPNNDACDLILDLEVEVMDEDAIALACNNLVNLSLNNSCQLSVVADMVLEDMTLDNSSYEVVLRDIEADTIVPNDIIPIDYINKILEVKIVHECSGNSCWGYLKLEDKNIPALVCPDDLVLDCDQIVDPTNTGFPIPNGLVVTSLGDEKYSVNGFDPCSEVILEYFDEIQENLCQGPYSSVIERTWRVTDNSGNSATCSHSISVNRATLDDLVMPGNFDDVLGPNNSIIACSSYPKLENGHPSPEFTGYPLGTFCLNVLVEYQDTKLPGCGDQAFKVRRRWSVTDLCSSRDSVYNQYITVMDNEPPVCTAPEEFEVGTMTLTCGSSFDVPPPIIIFECSEYDYYVSYKLTDESGNPYENGTTEGVVRNNDGTYTINNVPGGQDSVWIVYTIEDACGNISQCFTEVGIVDDEEPIAVCDLHTFVAVNEDGWAIAGVDAFDDGSWDNCMLDYFEVRRMGNSSCGLSNGWDKDVKFCCDDIGKTILVQMRVWDKAGNNNSCMVEVEVQDNRAPQIYCPAARTIDCRADMSNLSVYGVATATDNCGFTMKEDVTEDINDCGEGFIQRKFTATDNYGNESSCTQLITVVNQSPFRANNIVWPGDYTVNNGCLDSGIDPDDLPSGRQRPILNANACSRVAADYDDVVFQIVEGACFKILRTWTVIDWCQFNPFVPNAGKWTHTQVIMVKNNIAPTITSGCNSNDLTITPLNSCSAQIDISATATDDCSDASSLVWKYTIDYDNNGSPEVNGSGRIISRIVSYGNHKITWTVNDECGNSTSCSQVINISDTKKPTPYCLSGVVTVLMETEGTVTLWASDFDNGSYDNCTAQEDMRIAFSTNPLDISRTFTCDDIEGSEGIFDVKVYAIDKAGNFEFCTTKLKVQDNSGVCDETELRGIIAGKVMTENAQGLENVNVLLDSNQPEYPILAFTDDQGAYAFNDLMMNNDYQLSSNMEDDYLNGVSTLDIVLIQRHILGLARFDSPYKVIAADVNGSESVSASDLVLLRKLILGLISELPEGLSWKFVDANQEFENVEHPFPVFNNMAMNNLDHDAMNNNFIGVKLGDVNNSLLLSNMKDAGQNENRNSISLTIDDISMESGEIIELPVLINKIDNVVGFQFTLKNTQDLSILDIKSNNIDIHEDNFAIGIQDNLTTVSWNNYAGQSIDDVLMTIVIKANRNITSIASNLVLNSQLLAKELYTLSGGNIEKSNLNLETRNGSEFSLPFELYQNVPNPFDDVTTIGFNLPTSDLVKLRIYDYTGKVVYQLDKNFNKGYNEIQINTDELSATGILYYQLDSKMNSASKKMIIIK